MRAGVTAWPRVIRVNHGSSRLVPGAASASDQAG